MSHELYHACVAHCAHPDPNMMRDIFIHSVINVNNIIHVKMLLIERSGVYGCHTDWINSLITHETSAKCIILLQVRDSFLLKGGSEKDIFEHNNWYRAFVTKNMVFIDRQDMDGHCHASDLHNPDR